MSTITEAFTADHRQCDHRFAELEAAAAKGDWSETGRLLGEFRQALERHMLAEEESMFPGIEARTGGSSGPTEVMRMEHEEMRQLIEELAQAADTGDERTFLGVAETLLVLMQQHNMKEEQIVYALADELMDEAHAADARARIEA
ncbi:MAG: hemerythrin domain-containing protein [Gammaproteobacteria bacterium]|nr:hemerythrin domain-containing protein [Gammaproteobacteria bacterium]